MIRPTAAMSNLETALHSIRMGHLHEGETLLRQMVTEQPRFLDGWGHLAHLLVQQGRIAEAIPCYERILEIEPQVTEAQLYLGDAYLSLGEKRKAWEAYRKLQNTPVYTTPEIQSRLARCEPFHYLLQRGFRLFPGIVQNAVSAFGASPHGSGVCSGFWRGLGSEIRRLPESLPAIRTGGWYSYLSHLYQGLLREKIHQIPRNPCDYCDAVDFKTQFFHKRHRLVQCRHCGLECVERRPPGGQDVFSGYFEREEVVADVAREWQDPALSSVRIESMQQLFAQSGVTFPCPGKRVYELGCGQGQLLKALERERMNVAGMDGAGSLVNYARHTLHLTVDKLTLDQVVVPSHPYDFVLAFHVIEHLDAPSLLFKKAWELLCPGGFLFLETPILELNELPLRNKLDEKTGYANLEHMFFFTRKTLSPYFEKYGFILVGSYQFLSNGGFLGQKRDDAGYHPT